MAPSRTRTILTRIAATSVAIALAVAGIVAVPSAANATQNTFGSRAGVNLPQCFANTLSRGDDVVSDPIQLGFSMHFDGLTFTSLSVDTNGKVWLGDTAPSNGATTRNPDFDTLLVATISPFGSDASNSAPGTGNVTYGVGADGTFCAVWNEIGYYSDVDSLSHDDKLNTFQLLISSASNAPGRAYGDFDMTFNYDSIQWDNEGRASAGYTNGFISGDKRTLPGSHTDKLTPGEMIDGGDKSLAGHTSGSGVSGRYVYSVANAITSWYTGTLVSSVPEIAGAPVVGSTLGVKDGTWGPAPVVLYHVWVRDDTAVAQSDTYVVTEADRGHNLRVGTLGLKTDYEMGGQISPSVHVDLPTAAAAPVLAGATPKVSGTAKVGKKLTVKAGTWSPKPTLSYRWYANGKAIKKATKASYKIAASVKGKKITVKVTAKLGGYVTVVKASKATGKVKGK